MWLDGQSEMAQPKKLIQTCARQRLHARTKSDESVSQRLPCTLSTIENRTSCQGSQHTNVLLCHLPPFRGLNHGGRYTVSALSSLILLLGSCRYWNFSKCLGPFGTICMLMIQTTSRATCAVRAWLTKINAVLRSKGRSVSITGVATKSTLIVPV
jgi:hypothetical protein